MTLLEQCQLWHEQEEYQKIVDALQSLPQEEQTVQTDMELARAYNNLAEGEDRFLLGKAIALLKAHEQEMQEDYSWNFRIGYAYYYLNREDAALPYLQKALELHPGDNPQRNTEQEIQDLIDDCRQRLSLPVFYQNFRERTKEAWDAFLTVEQQLRRIIDEDKNGSRAEELTGLCSMALEKAFDSPSFELGLHGEKYELILTAEGVAANLFELCYFQRHAPAELSEHWNIIVGRKSVKGIALRCGETEISAQDVRVWTEKREGETVSLSLYCEKLLPMLQTEEERAWWLLSNLTDQTLGEVNAIAWIGAFEVLSAPKEGESVLLSELPEQIESLGLRAYRDARDYLENSYLSYEMKPEEDPEADWRLDTVAGTTRLPALLNEYLQNETAISDGFYADGIAAGFLCYPVDGFVGEKRGKYILNFRDALQAVLLEDAGEDAVTFLGGATGLYCGYLDLIAWDLPAVLDAAQNFFQNQSLPWAKFHTFRREAGGVSLWEKEDEAKVDPETGSLLSKEDIETLQSFDDGVSGYFGQMIIYLQNFIEEGVKGGRFTQKQARRDLQIALWYSYACNNMDGYEYYYQAAKWMPDSEQNAKGCGMWYYRYAMALLYTGKPEQAWEYIERGVLEEPTYPWNWLEAGKLRSHFGDKEGALQAVERGLELVPGDYEFLTLKEEIEAGCSLEEMQYHWINPDADRNLQDGLDQDGDEKWQAISCMLTEPKGVETFYRIFSPQDFTQDDPYCSFSYPIGEETVRVIFRMNLAGLSKIKEEQLQEKKEKLDSGIWLEHRTKSGETIRLNTVLFDLNGKVTLIYRENEEEEPVWILLGRDGTVERSSEEETEQQEPNGNEGNFTGFVLLETNSWDKAKLLRDLKKEWGIVPQADDDEQDEHTMVFSVGEMMAAISLMPGPIPDGEAEENAKNNYLWNDAVKITARHKAHLLVAVLGKDTDLRERGKLYTKLLCSCCNQKNALGVYTSGVVFEPKFYRDFAQIVKEDELPVYNLIWFGLYRTEQGLNAYTYGMDVFGKSEMEVLNVNAEPADLREFLANITSYVLEYDVTLRDGETIGFSEEDKHKITYSKGVSLPNQMTLKISYEL